MIGLGFYAAFATIVALVLLFELKADRVASRMSEEFRENDRKFYRKWEDVWFAQMMHEATPKSKALVAKKSATKRSRKAHQ